jgi:hypothetical protein
MDEVVVAAGVAVPLFVALLAAITYLAATCRQQRRRRTPTGHVFRGQGEAVTVAELLEDAAERGDGIRLNWSRKDVDAAGRVRLDSLDEFPTAILPNVANAGDEDGR